MAFAICSALFSPVAALTTAKGLPYDALVFFFLQKNVFLLLFLSGTVTSRRRSWKE
jgi:hypothetical protein